MAVAGNHRRARGFRAFAKVLGVRLPNVPGQSAIDRGAVTEQRLQKVLNSMAPELIEHQDDFLELCDHIRSCGLVAFDTEFVSDAGYRSELGLLQFATHDRCVAVFGRHEETSGPGLPGADDEGD